VSPSTTRPEQPPPDPHRISRLTRAYAQNRSLGVVVFMIIFLLMSAALGGSAFLAGESYRSGNMPLFWVAIGAAVLASGAVTYFSVPRWGGKLQERVVHRLYAKEGNVAFSPPSKRSKVWSAALAVSFATCVIASVLLDFVYDIPFKYMQPISALYVVPFLVGLWFLMRPMAGYAALLWPALYATHAILILAGVPILFTRPWEGLNMLIPIAGYGMLSGLVGHLHSRIALHRLKRLTCADQPEEAR
jgi:MFS family permease